MPVSSGARSAEIGSAKMPVELILGRIPSSEASLKPDDAANAESKFFQILKLFPKTCWSQWLLPLQFWIEL
jgi:hypothetical protein